MASAREEPLEGKNSLPPVNWRWVEEWGGNVQHWARCEQPLEHFSLSGHRLRLFQLHARRSDLACMATASSLCSSACTLGCAEHRTHSPPTRRRLKTAVDSKYFSTCGVHAEAVTSGAGLRGGKARVPRYVAPDAATLSNSRPCIQGCTVSESQHSGLIILRGLSHGVIVPALIGALHVGVANEARCQGMKHINVPALNASIICTAFVL
jgi:hypothetical protein